MVKNSITARCLNQTSENSSISMCTAWGLYASVCSRWSMMEERYHATTQNRFYPDMSNVNKNITVEAKLTSPPMYIYIYIWVLLCWQWQSQFPKYGILRTYFAHTLDSVHLQYHSNDNTHITNYQCLRQICTSSLRLWRRSTVISALCHYPQDSTVILNPVTKTLSSIWPFFCLIFP